MTSPRQAATYGILGLGVGFLALFQFFEDTGYYADLWLILLWPSLVLLTMAFWYAYDSAGGIAILGKNMKTGQIHGGTLLLMAPYFLVANGWWFIRHSLILRFVENPYDKVADTPDGPIYVGRWPLYYPSQFPTSARGVVDVTAEWWARDCVTHNRNYLCLPSLDCDMPDTMAMLNGARRVAREWKGGIYVHCANGHGRSSCFAALVLLFRGQASTWQEAFRNMKAHRKYINIQAPQKRIMEQLQALILKEIEMAPTTSGGGRAAAAADGDGDSSGSATMPGAAVDTGAGETKATATA